MILKILSNNEDRVVISVEFENELDKLKHANFKGNEKYITIDKGSTQHWRIVYEDDTSYSFSTGNATTIYGEPVNNIIRLSSKLLHKNYIKISENYNDNDLLSLIYDKYDDYLAIDILIKYYGKTKAIRLYNRSGDVDKIVFDINNSMSIKRLEKDNVVRLVDTEDLPYNRHIDSVGKRYKMDFLSIFKEKKEYSELIIK